MTRGEKGSQSVSPSPCTTLRTHPPQKNQHQNKHQSTLLSELPFLFLDSDRSNPIQSGRSGSGQSVQSSSSVESSPELPSTPSSMAAASRTSSLVSGVQAHIEVRKQESGNSVLRRSRAEPQFSPGAKVHMPCHEVPDRLEVLPMV